MSPPNYYAKRPDPPPPLPPVPPPQEGSPLPLLPDFQLCLICNKFYRKEHFTIHQQAYHPPIDNPPTEAPRPPPDTKCPLCPSTSKNIHFENVRLLLFHFLKYHLPDNLSKYFNQADKVKPLINKPSLPLELDGIKKKRQQQRGQGGAGGADKEEVKCPECGKILAGDLRRHMAHIHDKGTASRISYPCPMENCKVSRNSKAEIRKHLYLGHFNLWKEKIRRWFGEDEWGGDNFKCGICGWRGGDKWECSVHFILIHGNKLEAGEEEGNLNLKCPLCEETGGDKEMMRRHMRWIHGGELGKWRCPLREECGGMVVISQEDFEEHWGKLHGCKKAYLLRQQGKLIRKVKVAGKVGELFENKVCYVKVERVNLNGN